MAYDAYLKLDGINNPDGTVAQIEVLSFSLTPSRAGFADGSVRNQRAALTVVKHVDSSTPKLFTAAESGKAFHAGVLNILPAVQNVGAVATFIKYSFSNIVISSLEHTGNEHGDILPTEQINLEVQKVAISITDGT